MNGKTVSHCSQPVTVHHFTPLSYSSLVQACSRNGSRESLPPRFSTQHVFTVDGQHGSIADVNTTGLLAQGRGGADQGHSGNISRGTGDIKSGTSSNATDEIGHGHRAQYIFETEKSAKGEGLRTQQDMATNKRQSRHKQENSQDTNEKENGIAT